MSSGGGTPAQTTQTSDPWSGAQPFLTQLYQGGSNMFGADVGYRGFPGDLQAAIVPGLAAGVQSQYDIGAGELFGSPGVNAARNFGQQMLTQGGLVPEQRAVADQMQGAAGNFGGIYGRAGDVYNQAATQENPYLLSQLAAQDRRIGDRINSGMSGAGRYGSGAHTDVMSRALAEASYPVLAQDYANRQATRLGALGAQQAAAGGQQGVYQNLNQLYGAGAENAGKWAQLIPALDEARYAGGEHVQNWGKFWQDRSQAALANQVAQWNAEQARPWEQLSRYANILSGAGQIGGTKVTTSNPYQPSTLARMGGGALAGGALGSSFGLPGAGIGAAAGGLLGLLG